MTLRSILRFLALVMATHAGAGCSRFVWHEDPFTPDPAPVTEIVVSAGDTTYVLQGASYYLLASQRNALWNRDVLDDVAWRYRALFGEAPPMIAVRLDSGATTVGDSATTWRGLPIARVSPRTPSAAESGRGRARDDRTRQEAADSVRARLFAGPMLAATVAESWLRARAAETTGASGSQPGGPMINTTPGPGLPAWIEAGALRILGSPGAAGRAAAELRADRKSIVPLATLFTARWQDRPNAAEIVRTGASRFELGDDELRQDGVARAREPRTMTPGVSPSFIAQSVSVLSFIHERDPAFVARLADELGRGASVASLLASSATLPHDVASLDAQWRKWIETSARRR